MAGIARREYPLPEDPDQRAAGGSDARRALLRDADALARYLRPLLAPPPPEFTPTDTSPTPEAKSGAIWAPGIGPGLGMEASPTARHAGVLAPLYARDGEPWLLFTRRATGLSRHSGEISFPGGSRDLADLSLAHTALRETYEELALDESRVRLLGALPPVYAAVSNFVVTTYVGWLGEGLPELAPARSEVAEVIEAPLHALDDPAIYHEEVWARGGVAHTVMFYDYGPYRIWGLTGRLLHHLLGLLPPRE
jgi:8-oxo-dGTP pyrophosphatase MutT (NUDIX family)